MGFLGPDPEPHPRLKAVLVDSNRKSLKGLVKQQDHIATVLEPGETILAIAVDDSAYVATDRRVFRLSGRRVVTSIDRLEVSDGGIGRARYAPDGFTVVVRCIPRRQAIMFNVSEEPEGWRFLDAVLPPELRRK